MAFKKSWQEWRDYLSYIHVTDRKRRCRGSNRSRRFVKPMGVLTPLPALAFFTLQPKIYSGRFLIIWQEWRDSNPQPSVLETAVLPIGTTLLLTG